MATLSTLIGFLVAIVVILLGCCTNRFVRTEMVEGTEPPAKIYYCDEGRDVSDRLLYVTTLDGRLSALDLTDQGKLRWSVATGPGPLLSSSIHRLELTNNGKWVRMIPSLNGGLYKFDGDTVEPIPFSADDLLKSSFKFSDDLVISGGKETRSYGISSKTGQVLYECTMAGCRNATEIENDSAKNGPPREEVVMEHDPLLDDVIVVRRQTQTVRAVESRTGNERWNFSIGQHELEMLKNENCQGSTKDTLDPTILNLELKVVIPEGIICAVRRSEPNVVIWKYKFEHPIVSAWRAKNKNEIMSIDLFSGADWLWNNQPSRQDFQERNGMVNPSIYLGMHRKQLYIQESTALVVQHKTSAQDFLLTDDQKVMVIPWKPYPARPRVAGFLTDGSETMQEEDSKYAESTAIARSVLYQSNYVNGDGFFLYTPVDEKQLCSNDTETPAIAGRNESSIFDFAMDPDAPVKVIIISIWYWWKEILVISVTTAFILNFMLRFKNEKEVVVFVERQVPVPIAEEATEETPVAPLGIMRNASRSLSESNGENFVSRFQEEYDMVQCLGKGGFGVVFEVRNKLDDCHYAIKRVVLPNKQESKDRVMREVKTLAHCEHNNIVRYFYAWTETPPPGWQEHQDKIWIERNCLSTSIDIESPTRTSPTDSRFNNKNEIFKDFNKKQHSSQLQGPWLTKFSEPSFSVSAPIADDESDSCSFIQFKADANRSMRSETDDDSFQIEFKNDQTDHGTNGDSVDIVFQEPSQDKQKTSKNHHVISIQETSQSMVRRNRHKRPLSLDLTSNSRVSRSRRLLDITHNSHMTESISAVASSVGTSTVSNKIYLYIQMQLCQKQSLKEWLTLNDLSVRQDSIIPIFEQIVDAVEYVHLKGLIHRDLKPSNIFFSLDGRVKIGDFGLVTDSSDLAYDSENNLPPGVILGGQVAAKERHTRQVGTHLYMSPEQQKGLLYDYKVDIYSLGLILFELLVSFGTEMERICTLKDVRRNKFPDDFEEKYPNEYKLLQLMLAEKPCNRPTTFGIKARPPLKRIPSKGTQLNKAIIPAAVRENGSSASTDNLPQCVDQSSSEDWHFELPPRRKDSRTFNTNTPATTSGSSSGSTVFF
ncbi:eukaryotic translation initiation factor 2-alpha kinase-like [Uranotaenia lowii]|uniref:eukaryotic translation initiation factor 2-alpha kinase-like n=1 Tax=Uranotaenia lowii TaxID=190385 RepID=UPI00247A5B26|nr:eukaryotic translation initiation factor 2-alpha kinase-like [Uranotaenia lowii]